jgi:hypothetical protein
VQVPLRELLTRYYPEHEYDKNPRDWRQVDIVNDDLSEVVTDIDTAYHLASPNYFLV